MFTTGREYTTLIIVHTFIITELSIYLRRGNALPNSQSDSFMFSGGRGYSSICPLSELNSNSVTAEWLHDSLGQTSSVVVNHHHYDAQRLTRWICWYNIVKVSMVLFCQS